MNCFPLSIVRSTFFVMILFVELCPHLAAALIQPDSAVSTGGQFGSSYSPDNLINETVTAPTTALSATAANSGNGYASENPPTGGFPVTITLEFSEATNLDAFYLWNNATSSTVARKGVKGFELRFYDAAGGSLGGGSQIGSDYVASADQAPTTGTYAAQSFVFLSAYHGVRSVDFVITSNHFDGSWVGARELAFNGVESEVAVSLTYPDSATSTGGEFNGSFGLDNLMDEGALLSTTELDATAAASGIAYATADGPTGGFPVTITLEFASAKEVDAFYLWNNATNTTIARKGIKDFTLRFFDAAGGGGSQIGSDYIASAAQAPITGTYAPEGFVFSSTYSGVRSVQLIIHDNHLGSSWVGAREIAFQAMDTPPVNNPEVTKVLVYLVGGQSNADGYGIPAELSSADQLPTPSVRFYHANAGGQSPLTADQWIDLQPGSGSKSGNAGRFGPELQFGRDMDTALGAVRCKVAILKHTLGATNLYSDWAAGGDATTSGDGPVYQAFQTTVAAGLASLGALYPNASIQIEGMIWHQGEGDVNGGQQNNYQTNLTNFIADLRLTYGAQMKFVIVQLSNSQWSASATTTQARVDVVQAAQQSVADASPLNGMTMTSDLDVLPGNIIHFGTTANLATGARAAEMMMKLPITDADGNGLDDTWETTHFGSTGQIASADPDHDGWSNREEYQWLSSPLLASSRPAVMIDSAAGVLAWQPRVGLRYYVEQSRDLTHWTRVESYIPALDASSQQWALPEPGDSEPTFYRLGAQK